MFWSARPRAWPDTNIPIYRPELNKNIPVYKWEKFFLIWVCILFWNNGQKVFRSFRIFFFGAEVSNSFVYILSEARPTSKGFE
jgi:hypothetical protein